MYMGNNSSDICIDKRWDTTLNSLAVEPAKEMQKDTIMAKQQKSSLEKVNRKRFSPYLTILKMAKYPTAQEKSDVQKVALHAGIFCVTSQK